MSSKIKLKKLEEYLQSIDSFEKPKVMLEQYSTPSHIASNILFTVQNNYEDLDGKLVCDLGTGTGMLAIGSAILSASHVVGFDIDPSALVVAKNNIDEMEISSVDFVHCDVLSEIAYEGSRWHKAFDTVIMNPPFGTKKNAGMDMKFLKVAVQLSRNVVYSLHKTSTRDYIKKKTKELKVEGKVIAELRYNLESSLRFHKKASVDIEVDVWRFVFSNE